MDRAPSFWRRAARSPSMGSPERGVWVDTCPTKLGPTCSTAAGVHGSSGGARALHPQPRVHGRGGCPAAWIACPPAPVCGKPQSGRASELARRCRLSGSRKMCRLGVRARGVNGSPAWTGRTHGSTEPPHGAGRSTRLPHTRMGRFSGESPRADADVQRLQALPVVGRYILERTLARARRTCPVAADV
jgi:hypothetical protein